MMHVSSKCGPPGGAERECKDQVGGSGEDRPFILPQLSVGIVRPTVIPQRSSMYVCIYIYIYMYTYMYTYIYIYIIGAPARQHEHASRACSSRARRRSDRGM